MGMRSRSNQSGLGRTGTIPNGRMEKGLAERKRNFSWPILVPGSKKCPGRNPPNRLSSHRRMNAIRVAGPNSRDLILSNEDARKIRELSKNLNFLDHAKVVIIVP